MHGIDWIVLLVTLGTILGYGVWKHYGSKSSKNFLGGEKNLPWWTIGLSVMATQASAITFLSTTGQAFDDGMRFAQFYIGLPIAMIIISAFILPIYYKTEIVTAYQYLETRFNRQIRVLTAGLFLIQRGLAAGITIFAPSIILSSLLGWNLHVTNIIIGSIVIFYTMSGGSTAVSQTQKQQMIVILGGMFLAGAWIFFNLPKGIEAKDAVTIAGNMGKLNIIDWKWDLTSKYNMWSGLIGGTFLFLSYFGTDQSQVQRYISGKSLTESRLGLLFNGIFKLPMQLGILFVGAMVFVFFQFNETPLHFNHANVSVVKTSHYAEAYSALESKLVQNFLEKEQAIRTAIQADDWTIHGQEVLRLQQEENQYRDDARSLIDALDREIPEKLASEDRDYVFLHFILNFLPIGLIGLLIAVIFAAAMSSTSAELNALATCTTVDFYEVFFSQSGNDSNHLKVAKYITLAWGVLIVFFASFVSLFENLIEAVNIIGSLFYGVILGIFVVGFFLKGVRSRPVLVSAIFTECCILILFVLKEKDIITLPYLWLNAIGTLSVVVLSLILNHTFTRSTKK